MGATDAETDEGLSQHYGVAGKVYKAVFVTMLSVIVLNVFIAIMVDGYTFANDHLKREPSPLLMLLDIVRKSCWPSSTSAPPAASAFAAADRNRVWPAQKEVAGDGGGGGGGGRAGEEDMQLMASLVNEAGRGIDGLREGLRGGLERRGEGGGLEEMRRLVEALAGTLCVRCLIPVNCVSCLCCVVCKGERRGGGGWYGMYPHATHKGASVCLITHDCSHRLLSQLA